MENKKIYILLGTAFNYDNSDCGAYVIGVYDSRKKAKIAMQKEIQQNIEEFNFVEDSENQTKGNTKTLFYSYGENWSNYIELEIMEKEIL